MEDNAYQVQCETERRVVREHQAAAELVEKVRLERNRKQREDQWSIETQRMFAAWKGTGRPASELQEELRLAKAQRLLTAPHLAATIEADFHHSLLLASAAENERFHQEGIARRAAEQAAEARRVFEAATATAANTPVPEGTLPDLGNFAYNYPISHMREKIKIEGGRGANHEVNVNQTATVGIMLNY